MAESKDSTDRHLRWVAECRERLFRYVSVMVPSETDADEIVQQSMVTIWEKIDSFDQSGTESNFFAWASRIATNHTRNHIRKQANRASQLSADAIDAIGVAIEKDHGNLNERYEALRGCIDALPSDDKHLIQECCVGQRTAVQVATDLRRKPTSVSRSLRRIRKWLENCVERKLAEAT